MQTRPDRRSHALWAAPILTLATTMTGGCIVGGGSTNFSSSESTSLTMEIPAERLIVQNNVGTVTLRADPAATEITAEAEMIGRGRTQQLADEAVTEIVVDLERAAMSSQTVEATVDHPKAGHGKNYTVNWVITAPPELLVDVINHVGEISVMGFHRAVSITNDVGEVECKENSAGTTVKVDVGDVEVEGAAPLNVESNVGDVRATIVGRDVGTIILRSEVGGLELNLPREYAGSLKAVTDVGGIKADLGVGTLSGVNAGKKRFHADVNGGGPSIDLTTDVGDIEIATAQAD